MMPLQAHPQSKDYYHEEEFPLQALFFLKGSSLHLIFHLCFYFSILTSLDF